VDESNDKLDWALTFLIGFGFFTTGITWSVYNSYVPPMLEEIIKNSPSWYALIGTWMKTFIGIIMVLDNIAAITLQPWIGARSDKTWTRFGRRMPYIMIGIPLAAIFFSIIPTINDLLLIIGIITLFNVSMAIYRAPVVALMPDLIPSKHRSRANGVINLMGGIGAIYAFFVGSYIYEYYGRLATFATTSVLMILALAILILKIREKKEMAELAEKEKVNIINAFKEVLSNPDKSGLFILFAILFWFFSYNVIETWFTLYGENVLGVPDYIASRALTIFALTFVIFAVPAGYLADRIGRRNTIIIGIAGLIFVLIVSALVNSITILSYILGLGGIFWAMININSITIVWEIAGNVKLGAYTGLYYFFSQFAAIAGPVIAGMIFDLVGINIMFWLSTIYLIIALVCMFGVKSGEVKK